MRTSEFIKDKQEQVLNHYGLGVTNNRHIDCVICGGIKKMRINWHNGDIKAICVCGSHSLMNLLMELTHLDYATLAKQIDEDFGNTPDKQATIPAKDYSRRDRAIHIFKHSIPLSGTEAQEYLQSRGIFELPTGGVKWGKVYDHKENRQITAMIGLASTEFSEPRQMHLTYIEGGKKADIETQRKMHSLAPKDLQDREDQTPISIKLFEATDILGIAEGIESALSAKQLYRVPTHAAMNAVYLKRFRAPTGVKTLYVFADNDDSATGHAAAFECARGNLLCSNDVCKVVVRWPEKPKTDFNDVITDGIQVLEQVFTR